MKAEEDTEIGELALTEEGGRQRVTAGLCSLSWTMLTCPRIWQFWKTTSARVFLKKLYGDTIHMPYISPI